jgi:hypothetical protein
VIGMDDIQRESALAAAAAGRLKFLGRPCRKCGNEVRYTSSRQCIVCAKTRAMADQAEVRRLLRENKAK